MKNLFKKILLLALVAALLAPTFSVSAEKIDDPSYNFTPPLVVAEEEKKIASVVNGSETMTSSTAEGEVTEAQKEEDKTEETKTETSKAEETKTEISKTEETPVSPVVTTSGGVSSSAIIKYSAIQASIRKYASTNEAVKGWLYVKGTNINTPIIVPSDNFFYENRTWDGVNYPNNNYKNYKQTATYTDYRVKLGSSWNSTSRNIVIYGHNWTNLRVPYDIGHHEKHTLFGQLPSYNSIDFAKKNPYIYFSTGNMEGVWKVFSVAYIENDAKVFGYNTPNPTSEAYAKALAEFKERSIFNFDVDLSTSDHIITLDTCIREYSNVGSGQRFIVVARLLRPGESENQAVGVTVNTNVKKPSFKKAA